MLTHTMLALMMLAGTASAPKQGTLTYSGAGVTCEKVGAEVQKLHLRPPPCHEIRAAHGRKPGQAEVEKSFKQHRNAPVISSQRPRAQSDSTLDSLRNSQSKP